jgi:hypothetical protein
MVTILQMPAPAPPRGETPEGRPGRRIEWVGEASPFDDPFIEFGVSTGRYTPQQVALIRRASLRVNKRTEHNIRRMSQEDPGLSREVLWGPGRANWVQVLSYRDADILLASPNGYEFRDLDAAEADEPQVIHPPMEIRLVGREALKEGQPVEYGKQLLRDLGPR